jgi:hypothetical protein
MPPVYRDLRSLRQVDGLQARRIGLRLGALLGARGFANGENVYCTSVDQCVGGEKVGHVITRASSNPRGAAVTRSIACMSEAAETPARGHAPCRVRLGCAGPGPAQSEKR